MRIVFFIVLILLFVFILYAAFPRREESPSVPTPDVHVPTATTDTFDEQVLRNPKPVLVDFTAKWCGPCQLMTPILASLSKDFEVRKIDYDANKELVRRYRISAIPALLIFMNGEVVVRHIGVVDEPTLRHELEQFSRR